MEVGQKKAWADIDDSFSSTEDDFDSYSLAPVSEPHPEVDTLKDSLRDKTFPLTVFLSNLPYSFADAQEVAHFVGLPAREITFVRRDDRLIGKATFTVHSITEADQVLEKHGQLLAGRPLYMNLDGFFARGKAYLKKLAKPPKGPWWFRKNRKKRTLPAKKSKHAN